MMTFPPWLVRFLVLPWSYWFCREAFAFAVRYLVFAVKYLLLPWSIFFCREVFGFAVTVVGHRRLYLLTWNCIRGGTSTAIYQLAARVLFEGHNINAKEGAIEGREPRKVAAHALGRWERKKARLSLDSYERSVYVLHSQLRSESLFSVTSSVDFSLG